MIAMCFEIRAPFGTFKDPRTTRGYFSFPFPPKTALVGLLGGVLGIPHNECFKQDHFLANAKISLQLLAPPRFIGCRTNETQTKTVQNISGIEIGYPSPGLDRGFISPQTSSFLVNASYRAFVCMDEKERFELERRLKAHEYVYPPYLGRANMLAEIEYVGEVELQPARPSTAPIQVMSVFDLGAMATIEGSYVVIPKMPNAYDIEVKEYKMDKKKIPTIQVRTRSLVSMAYGKGDDFPEIRVNLTEAGMKRAFQIAAFKAFPALVGKHIIIFPD